MSDFAVATFNLLNFANAGVKYYDNQDPYSAEEYTQKINWTATQLDKLQADIVCVQEVFNEQAIADAARASRYLRDAKVIIPHADLPTKDGVLLPRVGIISRLPVKSFNSTIDIPAKAHVMLDPFTAHTQFSRPICEAVIDVHGRDVRVITLHLKSKRPDYLPGDDEDNPYIHAQAMQRSLLKRAAEAAGLRMMVIDRLWHTDEPLIVCGDFNDMLHSPTTQLIASTRWKARDRSARDAMLFDSWDISGIKDLERHAPQRRDVGYTHIHESVPEVIDHILLSEEFAPFSNHCIAKVERVDVYNDHLHSRERGLTGSRRILSDHGQTVASLRFLNKQAV